MNDLMDPSLPLTLTDQLALRADQSWATFSALGNFPPELEAYKPQIKTAFALSDFIFEHSLRQPEWLVAWLINQNGKIDTSSFEHLLNQALAKVGSEQQLQQVLRQFRHFHMLCIAWCDLLNLQPIEDSLQQVSELANQLIVQTNAWLYQSLQTRFGVPMDEHGPQPMLILGMGKLGGNELNFSSDIDLIFTYPTQGNTQGGQKSIEHQQFFTKLAQKLISALDQITAEGQVYRVDMRLRPFGDSGPLVMHFDAVEDYYQEQGREWERYAMLKARLLNPDDTYSKELSTILRPFIYRRYLDFSAIDALRNMKSMIEHEVRRRGLSNNIKLGQGGIREAEFIVQSLQLINGGRHPSLQIQSLQLALVELKNLNILPDDSSEQLKVSYLWLRKVEHCLQQFADKQTQLLPSESLDQQRLLWVLNIHSYPEFITQLNHHCDIIHQQFKLLVREDDTADINEVDEYQQAATDLWQLELDEEETRKLLCQWNILDDTGEYPEVLSRALHKQFTDFKLSLVKKRLGQRGLNTLNKLMPTVIRLVLSAGEQSDPEQLLARVITVFTSILKRTAYLQLLLENQGALIQLIKLCEASPWVTEQIARFPLLLDELINPADLYQPIQVNQYRDELRQLLLRVEPEDLELQLETLRQFKLSQQLKIAAADISGALPVMQVSDHITYLAETIMHQVIDMAWTQMVAKYGAPVCQTRGTKNAQNKGFAILGYGKLGGWELGYGSDLDLVFVHNCDGNLDTKGTKPTESSKFYTKLAQRVMHIFTIKTGLGLLYDVDMRLRPSGNAGLLVCHIEGFATYQIDNAWTWEHQALCRARFILGETSLKESFDAIRLKTLSTPRDLAQLLQDVTSMREKMRSHLAKGDENNLDLKQGQGGIADIEFITQFMLLAHTHRHPTLGKWTDNIRILTELEKLELLTKEESQQLTQAYLAFRNQMHRLALQNTNQAKATAKLVDHQTKVVNIWRKYLLEDENQAK